MSIIAAGTTTTTALSSTGNTDGTLQFQVNGTTPSVTLNTLGAIGVGSTPGYGTSGQALISGGSTTAPAWGALGAAGGGTGLTSPGTSGNVLTSNGSAWVSSAPTSTGINVQTFTSSGTWTKPALAAGSRVLIQAWGAGGSGGKHPNYGAGGGGGGAYKERWVTLSSMGATETITIGAGGASLTAQGFGNVGGSTTVGTLITAYGGGGGNQGVGGGSINICAGGGGAGLFGPGVTQSSGYITYWGNGGFPDGGGAPPRPNGSASQNYPRTVSPNDGNFSANMSNDAFSDTAGAGGGGRIEFTDDSGNQATPTFNGGRAVWGGAGGGGTQGTTGGVSLYGGNGGNGGTTGTAGTQPAGGGGGSSSGNSGAGAAGQVIITVFPA